MLKRAYSLLEVKEFDDEKREIVGIATTPATDRFGDVVEPKGADIKLPLPFLWQHRHSEPIGHMVKARATKEGIEVRVKVAQTEKPGRLKDRLDEAWDSIKLGLVRGLSIGFKPIEWTRNEETGGLHFLKWDWLELSAVTIPANAEATIQTVKSVDERVRAALGTKRTSVVVSLTKSAGDSALTTKSGQETEMKMNIQEQIKQFETKRLASSERMAAIMEKSGEEGRTLDEAETEEYDTLAAEVKAVDEHLVRLRELERAAVKKAAPLKTVEPGDDAEEEASRARNPSVIQVERKSPPGIEFARYAMCLGSAKGNLPQALEIARKRFSDVSPRVVNVLKAAVAGGTTTDPTWAAPLLEYNQFAGDFVEFLRPQTIVGKFGANGIPSLRRVPFNINIRGQTSGGSGYWVGQGKPKPLTKADFENIYLGFAKVANIAVLTEELLRFSNPSAELLVRDTLAAALIERIDTDFVDPTKALVANVSPASITNGVTGIPSSGNTADAVREDVRQAMSAYISANISPTTGVWIMPATIALALSLMRNALGQKEFPEITMLGGTFEGLPVIVSEYVPTVTAGALVILVNASDVWLADDGSIVIDASREASLEMLDNPTNDSGVPTPTTLVSMFQTNSVALRAERFINWKKRRAQAVQVIEDVQWGNAS